MKQLIILFFGLLLSLGAQADMGQTRIGGHLGLTSANVSYDSDTTTIETSSKAGFALGATVEFPLIEHFSFQPELRFAQKGFSYALELLGHKYEYEWRVNYLEIPLLMKADYRIAGPQATVIPFGLMGPNLAFNLSNSYEEKYDNVVKTGTTKNIKTFDLGWDIGAGMGLDLGKMEVSAQLRYTIGLTNIDDTANSKDTVKNRAWNFLVGVMIPLDTLTSPSTTDSSTPKPEISEEQPKQTIEDAPKPKAPAKKKKLKK